MGNSLNPLLDTIKQLDLIEKQLKELAIKVELLIKLIEDNEKRKATNL